MREREWSAVSAAARAAVICSNNIPAGGSFTNPAGMNQGRRIGTSGRHDNNVRNGATAGISGALPHAAGESACFQSHSGAGKGHIEHLAGEGCSP